MATKASHRLARLLSDTRRVGDPIRHLLDLLVEITGLECVYVAQVDPGADRYAVLVSRHAHQDGLLIPEGLTAAWHDTLCQRAFAQGVAHTTDADRRWPDSAPARALGVCTYMGQPIRDPDGTLVGALCALSHERVPLRRLAVPAMALFAHLLAEQIKHDRAVETARRTFEDHVAEAITAAADGADRAELEQQMKSVLLMSPWDLAR